MGRMMRRHAITACLAIAMACASSPALTRSFPSYMAFFDSNSAELNRYGHITITSFVAAIRRFNARCVTIYIEAHADAAEAATDVDARRAFAVYSALVQEGAGDRAFSIRPFGARELLVPTASGVAEPQNRRAILQWNLVPGLSRQCRDNDPMLWDVSCTYFLKDGTKCND